jgi:hypothetical protein
MNWSDYSLGGKTWLGAITDDSNPWLNAIRLEDEKNLADAFEQYISDALKCLEGGFVVRAALSCCCAGDCLSALGQTALARTLYREAGVLYKEHASAVVIESVREAVWAYREAYELFLLASERASAETALREYISLQRKADPFVAEETQAPTPRGSNPETAHHRQQPTIERQIDSLLRADGARTRGTKPPPRKRYDQGDLALEKSIAG